MRPVANTTHLTQLLQKIPDHQNLITHAVPWAISNGEQQSFQRRQQQSPKRQEISK